MKKNMSGTRRPKMDVAKDALVTVMRKVPPNTNVGLLVFSSTNLRNDWAYPLGKVNPAMLEQAIRSPQPGGGTPLGAYLKKGSDALLQQRKKQHGFGSYRLLVVTDGEATDPHLVDQFLPDVLSRGITVDCIGVDMSEDVALATRVHSYRRANNPQQLVSAVQAVLAEVGGGAKSDQQTEEDFALIAPIPEQMASAMLKALSQTRDHPIGEPPPDEVGEAVATGATYDPFKSGPPPTPGGQQPSGGSWFGWLCSVLGFFCIGGIFLLMLLVIGVRKASRNQHHRRRR
jgi:hypothetical protein